MIGTFEKEVVSTFESATSMKDLVQYFFYRDVHLESYSPFVAWHVSSVPVESHF